MIPATLYADSQGAEIAYKVVGAGRRDIVISMPGPTHLDMLWQLPEYVDFVEQVSSLGRVIAFDKRGTGLSDRQLSGITPEHRCQDLIAVMDAAGSAEAVLMGWVDSARVCLLTAALYPQRVTAVIAGEAVAVGHRDAEHPFGLNRTTLRMVQEAIEHGAWGRALLARVFNPRMKLTPQQIAEYARYESLSATPKAAAQLFQMNVDLDLRPYLADIRAPVLLLHDGRFRLVPAGGVRWLADRLPEATFKVLGGSARSDPGPPLQDIFEEVEEFLVGTRGAQVNRQVMSLLFTDVVGSTATAAKTGDAPWKHLLSAHRDSVRRAFVRFGGTEVNTAGDGFLGSFTLPSSALRCAMQVIAESKGMGFEIRAGVHTGEVASLPPNDLVGIAVHIAARVASLAGPSEVLMTDTVRTLVAGTGIEVEPLGERTLKGVPGKWLICRLTSTGTST